MSASASYEICTHTHATGNRCGSPALRGEQFCFYHHPTRRPPLRATSGTVPFDVQPITSREDLQMALSEVLCRLADTTLDLKRAGLLLHTLEMASANLAVWSPFHPNTIGQSGLRQTNPD